MTSTIEETLRHALFLARYLHNCDLQYAIVAVLIELGIPTKVIGFDYLKNAILLFSDDPTQTITKEIYPTLGKCYEPEAGAIQVEMTIRRTIAAAWKNREERVWRYYFHPDREGNLHKPTNSEFISMIARFLELWQGCCEEVAYEN